MIPPPYIKNLTVFVVAAVAATIVPASAQTNWNAFDDFYVNVPATGGGGNFQQADWIALAGQIPFDTGYTNANAWGYAGGNFNGFGNPTSVGTYVSVAAGNLYPLTSGGTYAGPGASYLLGGTDFFIGYNDNYGSVGLPNAQTQIGKYTKEWFSGAPDYANNPDATNNKYLWLQGTGLSPDTGGLGAVLNWRAPYAGTFVFSGSYVNGNYGPSTDFAVVDSSNNVLLPKVTLPPGSAASTFNFTNTMVAGDVVQFQAGTPDAAQGSPLGLAVDIVATEKQTNWNAFDDFYVNVPATGGDGNFQQADWIASAGQIPFDTGLTNANAWGYAGGNFNGGEGFPSSVGTYVSVAAGNLYPLTAGGTYAGPGASYLLGGTDFFIGYNDNYSLADTNLPSGQTQIGKYTKEWFSGAPDYANNPDATNNKYLWLQGTGLSPDTGGLGAVLNWTAPYAGTFVFSGSYVNGNYGQSTDFAVVDSSNNVLLPKVTLPTSSAVSTFNFTNTMAAGDVVQFQAATPAAAQGSPLGLAVSVQLATNTQSPYDAWANGFGLDPSVTTGSNAGAPTADPDGDGFANSGEYAFGTNPTVPNGSLLSSSVAGGKMTISWSGPAAGVSYAVQTTTNLATTPFQVPVPPIAINSVGGTMSFTNEATGKKFFRVQATITNN